MPKISRWAELPPNVRQHLIDRMRDRAITISDLNQLRLWIASQPEVPGANGTRTSAPSNYAEKARTQRPFSYEINPRRVSAFELVSFEPEC